MKAKHTPEDTLIVAFGVCFAMFYPYYIIGNTKKTVLIEMEIELSLYCLLILS